MPGLKSMDNKQEQDARHKLAMSVEEFADVLDISRSSAYQAIRRGDVPGVVRIGGRILVSRAAVKRMFEAADNARAER
jgi:excisionase family DNA binding protein